MRFVAVIPAAGQATRLGDIKSSKEVVPVAIGQLPVQRPRVAMDCLLEGLGLCDTDRVFVVLREGKWDIVSHIGDGRDRGLNVAYLVMQYSRGVPFTFDQAFPFVKECSVLFGFPDILFRPRTAFQRLVKRIETGSADLVLGVFPTDRPHKFDMVQFDQNSRVSHLEIKSGSTMLKYAWAIAAWRPSFTNYLHNYLRADSESDVNPESPELYLGNVIQAAIDEGMVGEVEIFSKGEVLDIGTPEDLKRAQSF